jgi:hypothetical protein
VAAIAAQEATTRMAYAIRRMKVPP